MEELSKKSCTVTNRVSMSMLFAESTAQPAQLQAIVDEAFESTVQLLDGINPTELRDRFKQLTLGYSTVQLKLVEDPLAWSRFLATTCDVLQQVRIHQNTIASMGDRLAVWDRRPIGVNEFVASLDRFARMLMEDSRKLRHAIEHQAFGETVHRRPAMVYSDAVCGVMIVLVAINQSVQQDDPLNADCAAMAIFGADLIRSSVEQLNEICERGCL